MGLIANIKNAFGNYFLKREMGGLVRDRSILSLEDAKTIGIIFEASNKEEFELVRKYVLYLRELKKKVKAIGYFSEGPTPETATSKLEFDFFSKKDLSWYNKPSDKFVSNFIKEDYDILIDLNIHNHFALRYIAGISKARFKVGRHQEGDDYIYDLMLESTNGKGLKFFLRQVDTYLGMLNKKNEVNNLNN
jgi:effector-binding domain-containing protein